MSSQGDVVDLAWVEQREHALLRDVVAWVGLALREANATGADHERALASPRLRELATSLRRVCDGELNPKAFHAECFAFIRTILPQSTSPIPSTLLLSVGKPSRIVARAIRPYKPSDVAGKIFPTPEVRTFQIEILDPEGACYFHPLLPGFAPLVADPESIQAAIVRALPDVYALKLLDLCTGLALAEKPQTGRFWWHDSKGTVAFGLCGRGDSPRRGAHSCERARYAERFRRLVSTRVRIVCKLGKASQEISGPLIFPAAGAGPEGPTRINKSGGRGRPTIERRFEVNEILFQEARRWHIAVPLALFALPPGNAYRLARYGIVRARMLYRKPETLEGLEQVATYSGMSPQEVLRAVRALEDLPLSKRIPGLSIQHTPDGSLRIEYHQNQANFAGLPGPEGPSKKR